MKLIDRYWLLGSKHDRLSELMRMESTEQWQEWVKCEYTCPGVASDGSPCRFPPKRYQIAPRPLDPTVIGNERGFAAAFDWPNVSIFRDDAKEFFQHYFPISAVWNRVYRLDRALGRIPSRYSICQVSRNDAVEMMRGTTNIAPVYCPTCDGVFCWAPASRQMGIIRTQIRDRPVIVGVGNWLAVHPDFFHDMKLTERFPDIKVTHKIKLYDQDPHGWVLPGDPDWDGVFRKPPGWVDPPPSDPSGESEESYQAWENEITSEWHKKKSAKQKPLKNDDQQSKK